MRQIKFRAWNHVTKKYFTPSELRCENGEFVYTTACDGKFALEQFTGLKDKNGEEIYEGDIVKSGRLVGYNPDVYDEDLYVISSNFIYNCGCCGYVYGYDVPDTMDNSEVVGNIRENPELIEA